RRLEREFSETCQFCGALKSRRYRVKSGRMSASREAVEELALSLRSARMPIMAALSVQKRGSAILRVRFFAAQAAASSRRRARLQATPPEAVTQDTFKRWAARMVLATRTSTMAAWMLAQRSLSTLGLFNTPGLSRRK